jgi:predicted O-methyltransferase YrrM
MWYVYLLKSQQRRWYYVGSTNRLKERLSEHNQGRVQSTKSYRPLDIAEAGLSHVVSFFKSDIGDLLHRIDLIAGLAPIDMVFLDADRGHYHEYFPLVKNYLSSQVVIVADNAGNMANRMQPFFDLLAREGWDYAVHNFDNGILVATPPTIPVPNKEPGDPF